MQKDWEEVTSLILGSPVARMMIPNQKLRASMEVEEFTRLRMEGTLSKIPEDHIAGKRSNSLQHCNLVHAAKATVDKEWQKLEKISAWNPGCDSTFCIIDESLSSEEYWTTEETRVIQRSSCTLRRYRERRFGLLRSIHRSVFQEQRSSASQMTAPKVMDIISRIPGWAGHAAETVSTYTQVKKEDAPKLLIIPKS